MSLAVVLSVHFTPTSPTGVIHVQQRSHSIQPCYCAACFVVAWVGKALKYRAKGVVRCKKHDTFNLKVSELVAFRLVFKFDSPNSVEIKAIYRKPE